MALSLVQTSPYVYGGIGCFFLSSASSDLLLMRLALMMGFALLTLAAWSDYSTDGSFSSDTMPFVDGSIDLSLLLYTVLWIWNAASCVRLLDDLLQSRRTIPPDDQSLYHFFQKRCGITRVEFDEIRRHGSYLELGPETQVPNTDSTMYLVLEGLVECETRNRSGRVVAMFPKRSGQFFDLKFFNLFSLPVGFDSLHFRATTSIKTKLFGWPVHSLVAMRDSKSPCLRPFWEYMILRALARDSIRHHLQAAKDESNNWPLPEPSEWYDGGLSCDFDATTLADDNTRHSLFHLLPPRGIRNLPPRMQIQRQGQQNCIEIVARARQDCMDKMGGEEGSWQNLLFVSTFGCFKESSSVDPDEASSPGKSISSKSMPRQQEDAIVVNPPRSNPPPGRRVYDSYRYGRPEEVTTPRIDNRFVSGTERTRQLPAAVANELSYYKSLTRPREVPSHEGVPFFEQQSAAVTAAPSIARSSLDEEEAKVEIEEPEMEAETIDPVYQKNWDKATEYSA